MSAVKDLIGLELAPYTYSVEKGKIRELVLAIGDPNPIYYDEEAARNEGYDGIPIPLTFLQIIDLWGGYSFQQKCELLNLNPVNILHGEQGYQFVKPIYAGDVLTVSGKVSDVKTKIGTSGGMNLITLEFEYRNQHNELVALSRNLTIERH
ncbi:MaoC family dehydratase N-terminal domain-containing protein [Cytobacillus firmus]|uniref:MaoC family dehydratase N-terminal domain-containing protein n=1 Tax=Cytobacillus firmus TaxID=1399 RepID=UPI001C8F1921|nr:MaoC family dehydratase N-terminal domain-containing protein [Cytobacillus firmus]MBX9973610.1 MaoC family dehydratase N-terminal domain-containing protein [Cytobacillus firmus]MDM5225832.1 MaoC family dehydratase N-terminal domain-containing protein [Cytobacillus sp. NJ13]